MELETSLSPPSTFIGSDSVFGSFLTPEEATTDLPLSRSVFFPDFFWALPDVESAETLGPSPEELELDDFVVFLDLLRVSPVAESAATFTASADEEDDFVNLLDLRTVLPEDESAVTVTVSPETESTVTALPDVVVFELVLRFPAMVKMAEKRR